MKYYYDDVLSYKWMADKFGMEFVCPHGKDTWEIDDAIFTDCDHIDCKGMTDKAYVATDSLALLKVQEGDVVRDVYTLAGEVQRDHVALIDAKGQSSAPFGGFGYDKREWQIIQRNGIAFHWPKEAV